ncbi:MAG TPA: invasion associated locus B family protein [Hyphomicrobiaceae bacterium]|nr:invasion associated locus B family protein [Hyphomicrobiaceae bacterium]
MSTVKSSIVSVEVMVAKIMRKLMQAGTVVAAGIVAATLLFDASAQAQSGVGQAPKTAAGAPQNPEGGTVKAQYGDWQYVCKPPPAGSRSEICAIVQSVTAEDRGNVGLTVYVQRFSNGTRVLRIFAPVGVLLPPGLGLKIDGQDVGNAPFLRCHTFACYAQVVIDDTLVGRLAKGKQAVFIIFQTEEAGIGIPISLNGFDKAVATLN